MQSNWQKMQAKIKAGGGRAVAGQKNGKKRKRSQVQQRSGDSPQPNQTGGPTAVGKFERPGGHPSAPGLRPGAPARPYCPPSGLPPVGSALLEPGMRHFDECLAQCYRGFVHQPAALPELAPRMIAALESLKAQHYFHYDVVFAGGTRLGRTFVRRILVGVPGITYKYLGLRIFAHPWNEAAGATPEMRFIKTVNDTLTGKTQQLLAAGRGVGKGGRCDYNLTLINLMEDEDSRGGALRDKAGNNLGGGHIAVSWHADSSLEDFSSIAVLNLTLPQAHNASGKGGRSGKRYGKRGDAAMSWTGSADGSRSFRVAMKCIGEGHEPARGTSSGGTPVLAVPLKGGDAYYMLNDFNHHHHHAVLAGSGCGRYSSTHRVAVTATDTWQYIQQRCKAALGGKANSSADDVVVPPVPIFGSSGTGGVLLAERLRLVEEVHTEIEFEWLRQWGAQGKAHSASHRRYWAPRMDELKATWRRLEAWTAAHCRFLADAAAVHDGVAARKALPEGVRCYDVLEQLLIKRRGVASSSKQEGRLGWGARIRSHAYEELSPEYQPFDFLQFSPAGTRASEVDPALATVATSMNSDDLLMMPSESLEQELKAIRAGRSAFQRRQAATKLEAVVDTAILGAKQELVYAEKEKQLNTSATETGHNATVGSATAPNAVDSALNKEAVRALKKKQKRERQKARKRRGAQQPPEQLQEQQPLQQQPPSSQLPLSHQAVKVAETASAETELKAERPAWQGYVSQPGEGLSVLGTGRIKNRHQKRPVVGVGGSKLTKREKRKTKAAQSKRKNKKKRKAA